jgi:hypothetical protein
MAWRYNLGALAQGPGLHEDVEILIGLEEQLAFLTNLVSRQRIELLRRLFPERPKRPTRKLTVVRAPTDA